MAKIRSDYVTNSSSSSFVIAYKSLPDIDEETLKKYPFLNNYGKLIEKILFSEGGYETTAGKVYRTKEEWDKYFIKNFGWGNYNTVKSIIEDDNYLTDMYNNVIKYLEKGFNILYKHVDYSDEYCSNMIYELAKDKDNFIILEDE